VTESNKFVEVIIVKKVEEDFSFTIRTSDDTAKEGEDYEGVD